MSQQEPTPVEQNPHLLVEAWSSEQLDAYVAAYPGRIYALIDSADEPLVWDKVDALGPDRCLSLFNGWAAIKYRKIAPYLAAVDAELLGWIRAKLGQKPWGIFVESGRELKELRSHLHTLLMARQPDGHNVYLRFYDPRITPGFVACFNRDEVALYFKDKVDSLIVEQRGVAKVIRRRR